MLPDDPAVLPDLHTLGISPDLDRPPDRACDDRVLVVVEAHETGLGDRRRHAMKAVEVADIGHQALALGFEHLPDGLLFDLGMIMSLGMANALVQQPGVAAPHNS